MGKLYKKDYYSKIKPDYFASYERDFKWHNLWNKRKLSLAKIKPRTVLDIGSGPGAFLKTAKKHSLFQLGIEPNEDASYYSSSKDLNIFNGTLEEYIETMSSKLKFDFINCSEVLEHIKNPRKFISLAKNLMHQHSTICIMVPNDYNPIQIKYDKLYNNKYWVALPYHVNYWNTKTFPQFIKSCGLKGNFLCTYPIDEFLFQGLDYVKFPELGTVAHKKRMVIDFKKPIEFYRQCFKKGIGREIVFTGELA